MLNLPTKPAGYVFDMDDTLVASAAIWKAAEQRLLEVLGSSWDAELANRYKGMNALDVAAMIYAHLKPANYTCGECQKIMRDALIGGFTSSPIRAMEGAVDLVRRLYGSAPMAIASGSPLSVIQHATKELGIAGCFNVMLSSESVARGKPHPDIFLAAAKALAVSPEQCIVFEDSLVGVKAARVAGMSVVCVPSAGNAAAIGELANVVLNSWHEMTVDLRER
jgi:beta-phosphoglucomutase-like phosphatase (HAD superfamily)